MSQSKTNFDTPDNTSKKKQPRGFASHIFLGILPLPVTIVIKNVIVIVIGILLTVYQFHVADQSGAGLDFDSANALRQEMQSSTLFTDIYDLIYAPLCIVIFGGFYFSFKKLNPKKFFVDAFGNRSAQFIVRLLAAVVLFAVGLQFLTTIVTTAFTVISPQSLTDYSSMLKSTGLADPTVAMLLYGIILGPIAEEFIFRGVSLSHFEKVLPFWVANIFQAILFGLYHMNLVQGIYTFFVGLFFGYVYHKTGNLL